MADTFSLHAAELAALPEGTVVVDTSEYDYTKLADGRWVTEGPESPEYGTSQMLAGLDLAEIDGDLADPTTNETILRILELRS
ncbi:MAG: hypothetical protein E4H44_06030 [Candidatus Aminicenantes bacterium]|nr:MAG: hypothetical protein E4H44_06030 [Candidatus Aminicenantes bacterium]HUW00849.1 hypothetical protein [Acidimicrobiales bacterium]